MRLALTSGDPVAISITKAIHTGDVATLRQLLSDDPGLASARIVGADGVERSMVHVAVRCTAASSTRHRSFEALRGDPSPMQMGGSSD